MPHLPAVRTRSVTGLPPRFRAQQPASSGLQLIGALASIRRNNCPFIDEEKFVHFCYDLRLSSMDPGVAQRLRNFAWRRAQQVESEAIRIRSGGRCGSGCIFEANLDEAAIRQRQDEISGEGARGAAAAETPTLPKDTYTVFARLPSLSVPAPTSASRLEAGLVQNVPYDCQQRIYRKRFGNISLPGLRLTNVPAHVRCVTRHV